MLAAERTATLVKTNCEGWFQFSRTELAPLIEERNATHHSLKSIPPTQPELRNQLEIELKRLRKLVGDKVILAKSRWYAHLCEKIHNMSMNPRLAWEYIKILTKGESAQKRKTKNMAMKRSNGDLATNDDENIEVMQPHFQRVFNNHRPVDLSALELIKQRSTMWSLNDP
ncbi:hypothetical protein ACHAXR_000620, partial [Thalassiosira sp. AJA248-18]